MKKLSILLRMIVSWLCRNFIETDPGSLWLAQEIKDTAKNIKVGLDENWGLDYGCWSVLM